MANVDPFLVPLPSKLGRDPELGPFFGYMLRFLHDMWQRTGAGTDLVGGAATAADITAAIAAHTASVDNATDAEVTAAIAAHTASADNATDAELAAGLSATLALSYLVTQETVTATPYAAAANRLILVDDDTIGGAAVVTLPTAATSTGVEYRIKKLGSTGSVTITPDGAETIDGAASLVISTQYTAYTLNCDGATWWIV